MKALKSARQRTAIARVNILFEQASVRPAYAKRYVALARRISSRYKVRIPDKWRRRMCKGCNALLSPGKNCTVRIRSGMLVMRCLECKRVKRMKVKR